MALILHDIHIFHERGYTLILFLAGLACHANHWDSLGWGAVIIEVIVDALCCRAKLRRTRLRNIRISPLVLGIFRGQRGLFDNLVSFLQFFATFERLRKKLHDGLLFVTGRGADACIGRMV